MPGYDEVVDSPPFFRPGGTMDPNAPSYVERRADRELLQALLDREYVFLLDSRQKGKSSLIARTLVKLRAQGVRTVKLDLQRIGSNVTPDQWYAGLLHEIGLELGATEAIFKMWGSTQHIGPLARFVGALREAIESVEDPVVLFVDEIDFVRALPFSVDEFFAAIRDCFNRRSESAVYGRLTFCLAGVATPSQLIQNPEITPFNIGRRIELDDFTEDELLPFAQALDEADLPGKILLSRVHYWVDGHPYLTQSLCAAALETQANSESDIDALVVSRLTASEQRQRDPNLADVERRMLEPFAPGLDSQDARNRVLEIHRRLLKKQRVGTDYDDPSIATLLLAGVAKDHQGRLILRNRVYEQVFNERWRQASLPDAESRRQRAAFRRGGMRVGLIAAAGLLLVGSLAVRLAVLASERDQALKIATAEADKADRAAYFRTMALMEVEAGRNRWTRVRELFDDVENSNRKGWEYGYWHRQLNEHVASREFTSPVRRIAIDPEGRIALEFERVIEVLNRDLSTLARRAFEGAWVSLSRDGQSTTALLSGNVLKRFDLPGFDGSTSTTALQTSRPSDRYTADFDERQVRILEFRGDGWAVVETFPRPKGHSQTHISPSGRYVWLIGESGATLWDRTAKKNTRIESQVFHAFNTSDYNYDETRMYLASVSEFVQEVSLPEGKLLRQFDGYQGGVQSLRLSPNGRSLLSGSSDGTASIIDMSTGRRTRTFHGHRGSVSAVAWSRDGSSIYVGSTNGELREYRLDRPPPIWEIHDHKGQAGRVIFNAAATRMITVGEDGVCHLYDVLARRLIASIPLPGAPPPGYVKLSRDHSLAFAGGANGEVVCFEVMSGQVRWRSAQLGDYASAFALAPDELTMLVGTAGGLVARLDTRSGQVLAQRKMGDRHVRGMVYSLDGSEAAFGIWWDLHVIRPDTLATVRQREYTRAEADIRSLVPSADGERLLVGGVTMPTEVRWRDLSLIQSFPGHTGRVYAAKYSPSENKVFTFGLDGSVRIMHRATGRLFTAVQHDSWVSGAEVTVDESRLISSCDDGTVRLWDIATGEQITTLAGNGSTVFSFAISRDESIIATAAQDGRVVVYFGLPADQLKPAVVK